MDDPNQPPAEAAASPASAPDPEAALEPIAPGVPRMLPPRGAAKNARDPSKSHPSYVFLAVVAITTLGSDIVTKHWAEHRLETLPAYTPVWQNHLTFTLARNRGGAWGLLQGASENVRRPFFLLVSVAAITFIVTLYRRLQPRQYALRWGLPLVLGGALGNVYDRIRYGWVIDFIDYKAEWVRKMNDLVGKMFPQARAVPTDHWPTFNVADVAICVGVALMAIDMFSAKRGRSHGSHGGPHDHDHEHHDHDRPAALTPASAEPASSAETKS